MPKYLIFTVGFEDLYFSLADMMCHTIRTKGAYDGDLVIFTTQDVKSRWAETINITKHPDGNLLKTGRAEYFHANLLPRVDASLKPYSLPYDYFMIKTLPGNFVDRNKYDVIYYFDSDMLIRRPLIRIFNTKKHIISGFHGHTAAHEMHDALSLLPPDKQDLAKTVHAIGGGVIGVPRACYGFYEHYRRNYLKLLHTQLHDMPSLSLTLIEGGYLHKNLPRRRYWWHYWGPSYRKQKMMARYLQMFSGPKEEAKP